MQLYKVQCVFYVLIWMGISIRILEFWRLRRSSWYDHRELETTIASTLNYRTKEALSLLPKVQFTKQNISNVDRQILFVHIGKAGGETIKQILAVGCQSMLNRRRRNACFEQVPVTNLSNHVYGYFHCYQTHTTMEFHKAKTNKTKLFNTYLFNIRHPVERIQSWYNYVHPKHCLRKNKNEDTGTIHPISDTTLHTNRRQRQKIGLSCEANRQSVQDPTGFVAMFFQRCFPTLNDWADAIQSLQSSEIERSSWSASCLQLAVDSILGNLDRDKASIATHLMANYRHYMNRTIHRHPENDVMVVRIQHLWKDLENIDRHYFHGTGDFGNLTGTAYTHGSHSKEGNNTAMTLQSQKIFCCALRSELLLYRELILRAINLQPREPSTMLQQAVEYCGFSTWEQLMNDCFR